MKISIISFFMTAALLILAIGCSPVAVQSPEEYYSVGRAEFEPGYPLNVEQDSLSYISSLVKLGTLNIKSYGICYGQTTNPTLKDMVAYTKAPIDNVPFLYTVKVKNLKMGTIYQVRSFLITSKDTIYGPGNFFRTHGKNEWIGRQPMPEPLKAGSIYPISTFFDSKQVFMLYPNENLLWQYNISTYQWVKRQLPSALIGQTTKYSFMLNGKGYCGNVMNTNGNTDSDFWEYDVATEVWRNLTTKPPVLSDWVFGFTDGKFGYMLNLTPSDNTWHLWRFDADTKNWTLINQTNQNAFIVKLISNGTNTFAVTENNQIYQFVDGRWVYFMDISKLLPLKGKNGYYGWVYQNKLLIGENYVPIGVKTAYLDGVKAIDINNKTVESFAPPLLENAYGVFQTTTKCFTSTWIGTTAKQLYQCEYYPQ
jgi:hypothetical protein